MDRSNREAHPGAAEPHAKAYTAEEEGTCSKRRLRRDYVSPSSGLNHTNSAYDSFLVF